MLKTASSEDDPPDALDARRTDATNRAILDQQAVDRRADLHGDAPFQHGFQHRTHEHVAADGPAEHHGVGDAPV